MIFISSDEAYATSYKIYSNFSRTSRRFCDIASFLLKTHICLTPHHSALNVKMLSTTAKVLEMAEKRPQNCQQSPWMVKRATLITPSVEKFFFRLRLYRLFVSIFITHSTRSMCQATSDVPSQWEGRNFDPLPSQLPHFQPILMKLKTKKDIRDTTSHAQFGWCGTTGRESA